MDCSVSRSRPYQVAETRFDDCGPLLGLGRLLDAETLLRACQQVFEDHQDIPWLGRVLGARANIAHRRGRHAEAVGFTHAALRMTYVRVAPHDVATAHRNLANYLVPTGDPTERLAHRLAAALTYHLAGMQRDSDHSLRSLADDLRIFIDRAPLPATVDELAAQVERVEGVHLTTLIERLEPDSNAAQAALDQIIYTARLPRL
jgi:hypothetical protein